MSTATSGRRREHLVRDFLAARGFTPIMRAAASKGAADLLHGHPVHGAVLVQVGTGNKTLSPADRERFCLAAELTCALPVLAQVIPTPGRPNTFRFWHVTRAVASTWTEWIPS